MSKSVTVTRRVVLCDLVVDRSLDVNSSSSTMDLEQFELFVSTLKKTGFFPLKTRSYVKVLGRSTKEDSLGEIERSEKIYFTPGDGSLVDVVRILNKAFPS